MNYFWTRLQNSHPRLGNSALARPLSPIERAQMVAAAADKIAELLSVLQVDHRSDHNTRGTPERVARMLVNEVMKGRFVSPPELTEFANATGSKELIVMGPIEVRSTCAHHLMPIYGNAYIGVFPSESRGVIGLSKYDRVVEHFSLRLQIQGGTHSSNRTVPDAAHLPSRPRCSYQCCAYVQDTQRRPGIAQQSNGHF